jgi:hypothetical protein
MLRFSTRLAAAPTLLALIPAMAAAQFTPAIVPPNALYQHPAYRFQFSVGPTIQTSFGRTFVGMTSPATLAPQYLSPNYGHSPVYAWSGRGVGMPLSGYISGSTGRYYSLSVTPDFEKAQRQAAELWANPEAVKRMISDQWAYEKIGLAPSIPAGGKTPADALAVSLRATTEAEIASGEALNHIFAAIVTAEARGAKGASPYVPPQVLDDVRFGGAAGEALNLLLQSRRLPFPSGFDDPALVGLREAVQRDFAAAAAPVVAGKAPEAAKLATLEASLAKLEAAAPAVIRELSFQEAIAARRFLNQLASTVRTLKGGGVAGLVNPAWSTEGTNVADLIRHMAKHKIQFSPAPQGSEPSYLVLHRGLSTYLFVLSQPKK